MTLSLSMAYLHKQQSTFGLIHANAAHHIITSFFYTATAMYKARAIYYKGATSESKTKNQIETDYITIKCHFNQSKRIYTAKWDILIFVITSAQQNRMEMFQNDIKQIHKTYTDTPKKRDSERKS